MIGVGLTSNLQRAEAPGNVLLPSRQTRLPKDCVANISQLITMNKNDLIECVGPLPFHLLQRIEDGVRLILEL